MIKHLLHHLYNLPGGPRTDHFSGQQILTRDRVGDRVFLQINRMVLPLNRNGIVHEEDGKLYFEFTSDMEMTREMVFEIFGNIGMRVLGQTYIGGKCYIRCSDQHLS